MNHPNPRLKAVLLLVGILLLGTPPLFAQQGGIVLRDQTPIYAHSTGGKVEFTVGKNWSVAGSHRKGLKEEFGDFEERDGRIHVVYLANAEQRGLPRAAWMNPTDIEIFGYDCDCDKSGKCAPLTKGFKAEWNECFKKARDERLAAMAAGPSAGGPAATASASTSNSKALKNDDIIALTTAGLSEEVILSKIAQSPATDFDTSVDALIQLKRAGVSKSVIEAMVKPPQKDAEPEARNATAVKKGKAVPANKVRVTTNPNAVSGCQSLGTVHAEIDTFWGGGTGTINRRLQEQTARKGGNVVLFMGAITTLQKTNGSAMMGDGEAYSCPE